MTVRSRQGRVRNLAFVAVLGVAIGALAYVGYLRVTAPGPRAAPGWTLFPEMPNARGETASAVLDGKVYVAGGYTGLGFETTALVSIYDVASNTWSDGLPLPEPRNHAAAASLDGVLYVSGGTGPDGQATDNLWALRDDGAWTELPPMPGPRSAHRIAALGGRLYVVGGVGGLLSGAGAFGRVLVFDPTTSSWLELAGMPLNRDHIALVVAGEQIWVIGGRVNAQSFTYVDVFDPPTDTWFGGPRLPEATSGAAEALVDGVIYISGGEDPARGEIIDRHWRLDTSLGDAATWELLAPPPLAVHGVPGVALEGRFAIIGGSTRPGSESSTAWTGAMQVLDGTP